ncbi:unnamed protein product [Schistosoma rodhaini]|nr:unnamed protein product [Schistosoma rodhaini]CAH8606943.1 unnamed protein product [Schistosoma rodhaini]
MLNPEMFLDSDTENDVMQDTVVAFTSRHLTEAIEGQVLYREKYHKEKIKTLTVALVICLNIDIDPPDVQKIPPFSRVEAWVDPTDANSLHALGNIGKNLQAQYERWQPRARYKQCLDPTLDDVKKLCLSLRRNAKDDRILFHYNGHGVPRPTENGEIWVFNTKFTKYIPLSLYDLQRWLGAPTVYVLDCQNAGRIIHMYEVFCERRKAEAAVVEQRQMECDGKTDQSETSQYNHQSYSGSNCPNIPNQATLPSSSTVHVVSMENTFMLAACGKDEDLPQNPNLPADLFTACLTTPIRMALRWHWLRHQEYFPGYLDETLLDRIPGSHSNRMSLLGEINWIFTAVTDTIAWCSFPLDIFQKLFRQDLLIASLFRNFLLAERIMKYYGCHPISAPLLLPTYKHNMWDAWDHTVDRVIHYLPKMLKIIEGGSLYTEKLLPIINPNSNTVVNHNNSGLLMKTVNNNYPNSNTITTTNNNNSNNGNNNNNNNNNNRIPGQPCPTGNIPLDVCTNRDRHFSTQQQTHAIQQQYQRQEIPQGIHTGLLPLKQVKATVPSVCVYPPNKSHSDNNIPISQQTLTNTANPDLITNCNVASTVTLSTVCNVTVSSTFVSKTTTTTTTTAITKSKAVVTADPLKNHSTNQMIDTNENKSQLNHDCLQCDNNNHRTVNVLQCGLPPDYLQTQHYPVTVTTITTNTVTTATLNTSSRTSELVSKPKVFKLLNSDSVAPPPGFNNSSNNNADKLQSQPVTTMLVDSDHHPTTNTTVEFISNDTNDSNKDLNDRKSTFHRVKEMNQLEIVEFTKQNTNDESHLTNDDDDNDNEPKFLTTTTTTATNNNDSSSIVQHTLTNEIEKSIEQVDDDQVSKTTVPRSLHPSSQQHQSTSNPHHDHHHQKDSSSLNNKVQYSEHEDNQNNEIVSTGSQMKQSNQIKLESKTNFNLNNANQEKICHENSDDNDDDDDDDDDDSTDNSESDDDIDVEEEDDDDNDDDDEEEEDEDGHDGGNDKEEEDNRAEQYKCSKTTLNVPNTIGSTTKIMNTAVTTVTTTNSTTSTIDNCSTQLPLHPTENCHESNKVENQPSIGITDSKSNLSRGISNRKLMNKKHETHLSHSISCSELYTHTNCNNQHASQPQITRQKQQQQQRHHHQHQHQPHSKLTHEQVNIDTNNENNTTNSCHQLSPGVVVENKQTSFKLKNNNHNSMVTTEKVTESTKLLNITCQDVVPSETNDQTQKELHVHVQQQNIENNVVVSAMKCKLRNDPPSLEKQTENSKNPGNSRIFTPVKPRQPPMHTQYPYGYEKLYLLPNSGDIQKVTRACRYRVTNNHYSNKSTTVSQQLEGPVTTTALPSTQTKPIKQYLDSRTCTKLLNANDNSNNRVILPNNVNYQNEQYLDPSKSQLNNCSDKLLPPPSSNQRNNTSSSTLPPLSHCQQSLTNQLVNSTVSTASTTAATTTTTTTTTTVFSGSVIGGSGPSSFFTSQMTAFKIWLQTADERRPVATQLPILLQILLSQSHRIRAMQLLSEFLDLGPWAVAHCLTVGIFPYIVRLFHSPVSEVKPYLVFIWGKIIASAQTEFGRNDSVRDFGYKYFIACLSDTENLTPLTRTITAFALAKMLEKDESEEPDPFFQDVYLKQNFLPFVQTQLFDNTPTDNEEMLIRMRLWLILALAKLWCKNDEARWFGIRHNLPEVLLAYLNDISPEVRAATVYALGNLIENQTTDSSKQNHADQISHEIGGQLVKYSSRDACPLVRCMVVEAFRGLIKQFESQLCAIGIQYIQEIYHKQSQSKSYQNYTKLSSLHSITSCSTKRPMRHSTISIVTPPGGSGNGGSGSLHISRQLELTSNHINVHGSWFLTKSSNREVDPQHNYNYKTHLINTQSQASPILRKSVFNPGSVFFTGSGNTPSTNIYVQFWLTLVQLAQDPYPEVSRLATILIQYLYGKIREKAEFQAIVYNSPNNNDNNHKFITNDDTTLIPSLNTSLSALNASFTSSNTSTDNVSSTVNELNRAADNINSSRSENTFVKESSSNSITPITTTSGLQMTTTNPSSSSLIHSAQFPGRRYQQTDQRLRVSVTNSPQLPNTIMSNNTVTCGVPATTTTDNSGNNGNYPSSLDTVHTQFFAWSCRWFTRPLLSKYGQLNNGQSKSQTTSKNSFDYEPVSLGTISTDPKAVAYTDRVNRLKKQRKISHLGRLQWERIAGQISHSLVTSTINANTTTTTINRIISVCNPTPSYNTNNNISSIMSRSRISLRSNDSGDSNINDSLDDCCLHPVAFYHHPLNHRINNSSNDTFCSISSQVKFHPYQPHLVMINSDRKGVVIHSTKNLKLLHSINTFSAKSSLFPEFPSTIDGYSRVGCVTDIEFINADEEESLLLTATDDGYIRIWRNYTHHLGQDPEILTAWNGITDLYQTDYPVGVVVHWSQHANQLMVSGDTRIIRIWDCLCESKLRDISTGSDTSVTCLTKSIDNHLLAAGFNDGGIRVWDVRVPSMNHISCNNIGGSSSSSNDNLIFNSQADTARIFKVVFSSTNRLYAVGAMGGIGAWHLSFPNENNNTTTPTTTTSNTSLLTTSLNSSNNGSSTRHDHNNLTNHPCRYISTVIRSSTNNSINNSSTTRRFRRLPCPPRLSLPMNSSVNCADLLVNLSSPHAHLALAGTRGQSSISLHRIQDGSLHSSIENFNNTTTNNNTFGREQFGTPICCAFHPNEPLIAAGFHDRTLVLLNVQNKSINKEV